VSPRHRNRVLAVQLGFDALFAPLAHAPESAPPAPPASSSPPPLPVEGLKLHAPERVGGGGEPEHPVATAVVGRRSAPSGASAVAPPSPAPAAPPSAPAGPPPIPLWYQRENSPTADAASTALAQAIFDALASGSALTSADLFRLADQAFGGTQAQGAYLAKEAYEAAELAVNRTVIANAGAWAPLGSLDRARVVADEIAALSARLPVQTFRDDDTVELQQFSTPPEYAFALAWVAGVTADDVVLEPSAGNGNLVAHALAVGAAVHVNEIAARRVASLRALGLQPTCENAEQLHNILAGRLTPPPTVVLMNPPFSRTIRLRDTIDPGVAGDHMEAALALLADGGRLVAITGRHTGAGAGSARGSWISRTRSKYALRANVLVSGRAYGRYGTHAETRVIVVDKVRDDCTPVLGEAATIDDLLRMLAPIRRKVDSEATDSRFAPYRPAKLNLPGMRPHPDKLVESWAMAAVSPPDVHYVPHFPPEVWTEGRLSAAQLEAVCYAGQSHGQDLLSDTEGIRWRRGYAIGDGTGVGKGRTIAAIILDNIHQGETRHVWVTANDNKLLKAARRDFAAVGGDARSLFSLRGTAPGHPVAAPEGIMLVSVGTLRSNRPGKSRVDQIVGWCGGHEFEGCLIIDEGHKAGNGLDEESGRGKSSASQTALAAIDLQRRLPRARVVYVSATQADQPKNLAYCQRLGIFGPGTPFSSAAQFCTAIEAAGIAGMEIVARDLKALGLYVARTLSYEGVTCERLVHELTPEQVDIYNRLALAWQAVYEGVNEAMDAANSASNAGARSAAMSAFYGAQQRFFNQVLISMQMPSVLDAMERDLDAGMSPVLQLVNTMEAQQERALAADGAMENLENLDLTPRDVLAQFILTSFPVRAFEIYEDEDGNERSRPVLDSEGNPVDCQEAVAMREALLAEVGYLKVPYGPLELVLDRFGVENVAELTGRSRRVVYLPDPETGEPVRRIESRGQAAVMRDLQAFWDGEKLIVVFSGAANEGIDLHAGRTFRNQRKRRHYLVQAGFNAKSADQGRGRSLRTDSVWPPEYILVTTANKAQMRFICTIARRLGALGAMTKGQRDTASGGLFSERDNLESPYGEAAVEQIVRELYFNRGIVADFTLRDFEQKLGLRVTDREGLLIPDKIPPVRRFLNRLLSLEVERGNALFEEFAARMEENIQAAIDNGTYLQGVETYTAERIEVVSAPKTVFREPLSGAETQYVHLRALHRRTPRNFEYVAAGHFGTLQRAVIAWVREAETGDVFAVAEARHRMAPDGAIIPQVRLLGPYHGMYRDEAQVFAGTEFVEISEEEARSEWYAQSSSEPETWSTDLHLICGVLLPVWDRIDGSWKVFRVTDEDGNQYLGRMIDVGRVRRTLTRLGADVAQPWQASEVQEAVLANQSIPLANGWALKRARLANQWRIEVTGWAPAEMPHLRDLGLMTEYLNYKHRAFVPVDSPHAMNILLDAHPVAAEADERPEMKHAA
jgi:hypothetical protein